MTEKPSNNWRNKEVSFPKPLNEQEIDNTRIRLSDIEGQIIDIALSEIGYYGFDHPEASLFSTDDMKNTILTENKPFSVYLRQTSSHTYPEPVVIIHTRS